MRWTLWGLFVTAWTIGLVVPVPPHPFPEGGEFEATGKFIFAKLLHVSAYAVMAWLSAWLRTPAAWRPAWVFFLMAHGTATELIQANLSYREGTLRDVGFDNFGVMLGMLASWNWWTRPTSEAPNALR